MNDLRIFIFIVADYKKACAFVFYSVIVIGSTEADQLRCECRSSGGKVVQRDVRSGCEP